MEAHIDVQFWSDERLWPFEPPGYVFILRAVAEIGRAMYPVEWTSQEYLYTTLRPLPDWHDANGGDWQRATTLLRLHPNEPQRKPVADDIHSGLRPIKVKDGVVLDRGPREQYEAARAISIKQYGQMAPAVKRLDAVMEKIVGWLRAGVSVGALGPGSGKIGPAMPVDWWWTKQCGPRFYRGQLNPRDPFGSHLSGSNHQWIFLTRESHSECLKRAAEAIAPPPGSALGDKSRSFAKGDEKLIGEMHKMVKSNKAKSVLDAARQVAPRAQKLGTEESAIERLQRKYGAKFPQRRRDRGR
jgi:hypothetical protein